MVEEQVGFVIVWRPKNSPVRKSILWMRLIGGVILRHCDLCAPKPIKEGRTDKEEDAREIAHGWMCDCTH